MSDSSILVSTLGPVLLLVGTVVSTRMGKKGAREIALVEQWRGTADELEKDVAFLKRENRLQSDYINRLRLGCVAHGFQPEEYPQALREIQEGKNV